MFHNLTLLVAAALFFWLVFAGTVTDSLQYYFWALLLLVLFLGAYTRRK